MNVILASISPDDRVYCATACLEKAALQMMKVLHISHGYFEPKEFTPNDLALTTLASMHILNHSVPSNPLTKDQVQNSIVIAMDSKTRDRILAEFRKLVPLYNEVGYNKTTDVSELEDLENFHDHIIPIIHHLEESSPKVVERIEHYY